MAEVKILVKGYFKWLSESKLKASSNISLIKDGKINIIVDTGNVIVGKDILTNLKKEGLEPEDIDIVVNTHFHSDHRDNNYLFKNATIYIQEGTEKEDVYDFFPVLKTIQLSPNTKIIHTPGHTAEDISVLVNTEKGTYAVVGDLFFFKQQDTSEFVLDEIKLQESKKKVLTLSDYVIPGHAGVFKVKK